MIKKYEKAFKEMLKKADEEWNAAEGVEDMYEFHKVWSAKYPFYPYGDEDGGIKKFIDFIKENFKDKK